MNDSSWDGYCGPDYSDLKTLENSSGVELTPVIHELIRPFGCCANDYAAFGFLLSILFLMAIGNITLIYAVLSTLKFSRTDIIILNQAIVDLAYTLLFPLIIVDARREIRWLVPFTVFKIAEDSLLTLSVVAVILVNAHKYLYVKSVFWYYTNISKQRICAFNVAAWILTPVGFSLRNFHFDCRPNSPCGLSYFYCLTGRNASGEISSVLFYCAAVLFVVTINVKLIVLALNFQDEVAFRKASAGGRRNYAISGLSRRRRQIKIIIYPLATSLAMLLTLTPFWISMALCHLNIVCVDHDHSLFNLMRLHSMINPVCTLLTHRKYRKQLTRLRSIFMFWRSNNGLSGGRSYDQQLDKMALVQKASRLKPAGNNAVRLMPSMRSNCSRQASMPLHRKGPLQTEAYRMFLLVPNK